MKVLDLFSGTGSATVSFSKRGHETYGIELDPTIPLVPQAGTRIVANILQVARDPEGYLDREIAPGWRPDVIWAGPPCEGFSVASIGRHWEKDAGGPGIHLPKHDTSRLGLKLLTAAVHIIDTLKPQVYFIENPVGMMRKAMPAHHPHIPAPQPVSYCQYGPIVAHNADPPEVYARKDTDIFSNIDIAPRRCTVRGGTPITGPGGLPFIAGPDGKPCHEKAERGAVAGVQRIPSSDPNRSKAPEAFSESMFWMACRALWGDRVAMPAGSFTDREDA